MTYSVQIYRIRIGTFQNCPQFNKKVRFSTSLGKVSPPLIRYFIFTLVVSFYLALLNPFQNHYVQYVSRQNYRCQYNKINYFHLSPVSSHVDQFKTWDPGLVEFKFKNNGKFSWMTRIDRNKLAHSTNGNRNLRGKGMTCLYWNKGPSLLSNKMLDIENIIGTHKPHIFGLGEANHRSEHDIEIVRIPGYKLHLDSCIQNPDLGVARVALYTQDGLKVKRREDLEDDLVASIWLECGLPNQKSVLVCMGYRQWQLLGQSDKTSLTVSSQLSRWKRFLQQWELALQEDKEVIVSLAANIDHLTWRSTQDLPPYHSSVRLKPLIDELFSRIISLGVSQLVTGATRVQKG